MCELKKTKSRDIIFLCIVTVAMTAMAVLRESSVGVDYGTYASFFQEICQNGFSHAMTGTQSFPMEPGYRLLTAVISLFTHDTYLFMGIISVLIIVPRMLFVYKYSKSIWLSIFVYVSFGFFGYALCTLRQEMGITIALFAIPYLQDKKPIPYFFIVILAAMFHSSIWIFVPIYFLAHLPLNWKTLTAYSSTTLFVFMFSEPILNLITNYIYTSYKPGTTFTEGRSYNTAFVPILLFLCVMLVRKRLVAHNPKNIVLMNFTCYSAFLFALTLKHFVFQRVALLFLPAAILLLPELLSSMAPNKDKYAELAAFKDMDKVKKKQISNKYTALRKEYDDDISLYFLTLGFILFGGIIYFLFLQFANRLLLIPYDWLFY